MNEMTLWSPAKPLGGRTAAEIRNAKVFLWEGHCPVHAMFTLKQIEILRKKDTAFKVISHPECAMEVVDASEFVGSTEYIVSTIANSPAGSKWAVGTEMNLVNRIALENKDKTVVSINPFMCLCGTMNRIDMPHLLWSMEQVIKGEPKNVIEVHEPDRSLAKSTLDRMLSLSLN